MQTFKIFPIYRSKQQMVCMCAAGYQLLVSNAVQCNVFGPDRELGRSNSLLTSAFIVYLHGNFDMPEN